MVVLALDVDCSSSMADPVLDWLNPDFILILNSDFVRMFSQSCSREVQGAQ